MEVLGSHARGAACGETRPLMRREGWLGKVAEAIFFLCLMVEISVIQPCKRRRATPEARPAEKPDS